MKEHLKKCETKWNKNETKAEQNETKLGRFS